jgi:hypothetical protein
MAERTRLGRRAGRVFAIAALAAVALAVLFAQPATASSGGGTTTELFRVPTSVHLVGSEVVVSGFASDLFTGTLDGVGSLTFSAVIEPSGVARVLVDGTCTCTVEGRTGSVRLTLVLRDTTSIGGSLKGLLFARGISDDLTGFRGIFRVHDHGYSGFYSL